MGFTIFAQSGTFNPADYGLKVGDNLHIICMGGGGGGSGYTAGTAGGTTSFGSYLSAVGGSSGGTYTSEPGTQGSAQGGRCVVGPKSSDPSGLDGGGGAGGWYPGASGCLQRGFDGHITIDVGVLSLMDTMAGTGGHLTDISTGTATILTGIRTSKGGGGGGYPGQNGFYMGVGAKGGVKAYNDSYGLCGGGGAGYGAGGGGGGGGYTQSSTKKPYAGGGGNAGEFKFIDVKLSSINSIAVTIGAGGSGGSGYGGSPVTGGAGASGCVAIYW